ncbi:polysaccharide deacetylase family protein [Treponema primitia]|uniref:polysaccharide deacetylase family protein n=1 Tax=Treponema primitia TaxID=88058 RepID=UPI00397FBB31
MFCLLSGFLAALCILFSGCQTLNRTNKQIPMPDKLVIFTFDDGPNAHADTTARLLEVLGKYHIRGMFALLGENVEHNPELAKRIHDEGHYLINHGYGDAWAVNLSRKKFSDNLIRGESAISEALEEDLRPLLYRPHGGFYTTKHLRLWEDAGYRMIPATARAYDAVLKESQKATVRRRILRALKKQGGGLILLHDARDSHIIMEENLARNPNCTYNRSWIPEFVEELILYLEKQGYVLRGFDIPEVLNFYTESAIVEMYGGS